VKERYSLLWQQANKSGSELEPEIVQNNLGDGILTESDRENAAIDVL
jgi:hypothetical protein